jgi:hypothetical protein
MARLLTASPISLLVLTGLFAAVSNPILAQSSPQSAETAAEPSVQSKIAELKAAKKNLARQARETNGEDIPQSKIEHTLGHIGSPLYNPNG